MLCGGRQCSKPAGAPSLTVLFRQGWEATNLDANGRGIPLFAKKAKDGAPAGLLHSSAKRYQAAFLYRSQPCEKCRLIGCTLNNAILGRRAHIGGERRCRQQKDHPISKTCARDESWPCPRSYVQRTLGMHRHPQCRAQKRKCSRDREGGSPTETLRHPRSE